jgi:hypothetical protein
MYVKDRMLRRPKDVRFYALFSLLKLLNPSQPPAPLRLYQLTHTQSRIMIIETAFCDAYPSPWVSSSYNFAKMACQLVNPKHIDVDELKTFRCQRPRTHEIEKYETTT